MTDGADTGSNSEDPGVAWAKNRLRAQWESISVSVAMLFVVAAGVIGLWLSATNSIRDNYRLYLIGLAQTASTLVDPELHNSLRHPEQRNGPDYNRAVQPLRRMRAAVPDVHYIYTMVQQGSELHFVLDAADPDAHGSGGIDDQAGVWELYGERSPEMLQALGNGRSPGQVAASDSFSRDKWGAFMTGVAPILDASGRQVGVVGVDVDASTYLARLSVARNRALLGLAPAGVLILILGGFFYRVRLRGLADAHSAIEAARVSESTAKALAMEQQRLATITEGIHLGTWERDYAADSAQISETWAAMIGYRTEELHPLTQDTRHAQWQSLVHPEDVRNIENAEAASLTRSDGLFACEFRMKHADGHWIWIQSLGKVLERDSANNPLRMAGIHLDISERKAVELALKESESKFRSLFELSPVGIALNDLQTGRFLQVNDALLAPTGYSREELLCMTYWDITPETYSAQESSQIKSLEQTNRYGPYEKEYRRKDGSTYSVLLSGIRMQDAAGRDLIWSIVQDISGRKAMESELAAAARRDRLTGLANRAQFMEHLQTALLRVRSGKQRLFAVLFLDFDRFKLINDTLGHQAGDELLQQISRRLQSALRGADIRSEEEVGNLVGRFGGDEFLILINDLKDAADAGRIAERLLNSLAPVYTIFGTEVHSTASIGIVTSEQCQSSAEDVVRNADVAMYEAKRSGRACSVLFSEAMHTRLTRHVAIETSLRRAIGTPELCLFYQPIVDLSSGQMVSAEALVRWQHPTLGQIMPSEFIPLAEESGLILALGQWVLREACQALAHWRKLDPQRAPRTVSVNISRAELAMGRRLLEQVRATLEAVNLPPHCLQLEVTEREVMRNPEASLELMHELHRLGVQLAMDDFGTGTSSLAFLRDHPFTTIKLDRSFVKDLTVSREVLAVIHATVTLVENLGMASVAEGVEQHAQVAVLQSLGCHYAQGYYFSRPVPHDQLLDAMDPHPALMVAQSAP